MKNLSRLLMTCLFLFNISPASSQQTERHPEMIKAILSTSFGMPQEAYKIYLKLSKEGMTRAQIRLARALYDGEGVEKDLGKAKLWYERAAKLGNKNGQYILGDLYYNGLSTKRDYNQALIWFYRAAYNDNKMAPMKLGIMHSRGLATKKDRETAQMWFEIYKIKGGKDADTFLNANGIHLTDSQRSTAIIKAKKWSVAR